MTKLVVTLMGGGREEFPGATFRAVEDWLIVYDELGEQLAVYGAHRVVRAIKAEVKAE